MARAVTWFTWIFCCSLWIFTALTKQIAPTDQSNSAENCHKPLGIDVPPIWLYASDGNASDAVLGGPAAWRSRYPTRDDAGEEGRYAWIQVDLGRAGLVTGIQIQGDPEDDAWVTVFSLQYSTNCEHFQEMTNRKGDTAMFHGNFDGNSVVTNIFPEVVLARCVRVEPREIATPANIPALRIELMGCDNRVCREAVIQHLAVEARPYKSPGNQSSGPPPPQPLALGPNSKFVLKKKNGGRIRFNDIPWEKKLITTPTVSTRGYAEFKFDSEQLVMGVVLYPNKQDRTSRKRSTKKSRFMVTYSRNCHAWIPVKDSKGLGDPKMFYTPSESKTTKWFIFPYTMRAHCMRLIPVTHRYSSNVTNIRAHFIGCGTGESIINECGRRKVVPTVVTPPPPRPTSVSNNTVPTTPQDLASSPGPTVPSPSTGPLTLNVSVFSTPQTEAQIIKGSEDDDGSGGVDDYAYGMGSATTTSQALSSSSTSSPPRHRVRRVIGGQPQEAGLWPWLVSIQIYNPRERSFGHVCGGSLVHPQFILTAAHCVNVMYSILGLFGNTTLDPGKWNDPLFLGHLRVVLGEHSLTYDDGTLLHRGVSEIITHPNYNISYYLNDIALIKMSGKSVRITDHVNLVCLPPPPPPGQTPSPPPPGTVCRVVGWGRTKAGFPSLPHGAPVPLLTQENCQEKYAHLVITDDMICAGPDDGTTDACLGDSGGPLVCEYSPGRWYQQGVVSWNIGCGTPGYPGVYANVATFTVWLDDIITKYS